MHVLSARRVQSESKRGYYCDGGGLYLQVAPGGSKSWIFRYGRAGRSREMGLGSLNAFSLAEAREKARRCRQQLAEGLDPIEARNAAREASRRAAARTRSFRDCAKEYIAANRDAWKNAKHQAQWENTLEAYCYDKIGDTPVALVDTAAVMGILEPIWKQKTETAKRVRGRLETVLNWAKVHGLRAGENPAAWRGHLDQLLPRPSKLRKVKHHAALPFAELPAFFQVLRGQAGSAARALEFIILTVARTNEAIGARGRELQLAERLWTVPAERMKSGTEHRVPLSAPALAIAKACVKDAVATTAPLFPSPRGGGQLSNMACLQLLKRMGRDELTVHGFRSTFRDWAGERTTFPREIIEACLAHAIDTKTEAAYRRGDFLEKRRRLMEAWAEYCTTVRTGNVANIRERKAVPAKHR